MVLKGTNHETFVKTVRAEEKLGNKIIKKEDGRYYSVPESTTTDAPVLAFDQESYDKLPSGTRYVDKNGNVGRKR
jgi:hypothetical protein